ncbi:MAG: hypothetical protein M3Y72_13720 [Acidobacteriota bacterium]|nr:hypothetical protein [Acidobacteriota bacterium]
MKSNSCQSKHRDFKLDVKPAGRISEEVESLPTFNMHLLQEIAPPFGIGLIFPGEPTVAAPYAQLASAYNVSGREGIHSSTFCSHGIVSRRSTFLTPDERLAGLRASVE